MTGSTGGRRVPGAALLGIARLLFDERLLSAVVLPTIADLQREVAEAGPDRAGRRRARWRGYRAFWKLAIAAPFLSWPSPGIAFPDALARLAIGSILLTLLAVIGPVLGAWVALVAGSGALFAIAIRAWYARHPSDLPAPAEPQKGSPQINFSSTDVAGNIGGLIFVVGSVFIISVGLPSVIWFLLAGTAAGGLLAWGLVAWHASHPRYGLPGNRIVWR